MKRGSIIVLLSCVLSAAALGAEGTRGRVAKVRERFGPPVMWVSRPAKPPVIDGKLDDACWAAAEPVKLRFLTGRWDTPAAQTEARVLADAKAVYFAVRCAEPHPDRIIAAGKGRDGPLWNGDTVEFFLDPGHASARGKYAHVIVNPDGQVYDSRDGKKSWNADLSVKTVREGKTWTVELAVPMADLGVAGAVPRVWGLNINRQRPELGVVSPTRGITSTAVPLKEPEKYREGEDTAWAPTDCYSSHIAQRFGHAVLEAGTVEVAPPKRPFEVVYRNDFDDGDARGWRGAKIVEENFRGPGKCITPAKGGGAIQFAQPLKDLDDVYLVMAFKMPRNGRLYYYGRAPDNMQCDADFHMVWMDPAEAKRRAFPALADYDTHGSMMAWKSHGRLRDYPGPWALMTGHFSEPSIGSVMQPGTDWCILRTHLGTFRRQQQQNVVPISQNYPRGLTFATGSPYFIDQFVIFRGMDVAPPSPPGGVKAAKKAGKLVVSWDRAEDNTITAFYRVVAGGKALAESHRLSAELPAGAGGGKPITVLAVDLYGNVSPPSAPAR